MGKDIDIIKVITHADGGKVYSKSATNYPSNKDSVAVKGYGVDASDEIVKKCAVREYPKSWIGRSQAA